MNSNRQQWLNYNYRYFWNYNKIDKSTELYTLFWKHLVDEDKISKENKTFVPPDKLDKNIPLPKNGITWDDIHRFQGRYLKDYCYTSGCPSLT